PSRVLPSFQLRRVRRGRRERLRARPDARPPCHQGLRVRARPLRHRRRDGRRGRGPDVLRLERRALVPLDRRRRPGGTDRQPLTRAAGPIGVAGKNDAFVRHSGMSMTVRGVVVAIFLAGMGWTSGALAQSPEAPPPPPAPEAPAAPPPAPGAPDGAPAPSP